MNKPRIYVETSVISYLTSRPSNDEITAYRQRITKRWFDAAQGVFDLQVSELVRAEIAAGDPVAAAKRIAVYEQMQELAVHPDTPSLSKRLMFEGLVPLSEPEDASHIAQAVLTGAHYIATWNFAHMVGPQVKYRLVQAIERWGYAAPPLTTPEELLEGLLL